MNRNYKFSKFLPPILPFDAKSHYPLPYTVVNDKIEDTHDSYFHFFSACSGGRNGRREKENGISESRVPETH